MSGEQICIVRNIDHAIHFVDDLTEVLLDDVLSGAVS